MFSERSRGREKENIMSEKYVSSPIIEAICEFRVASDAEWDLTIPGLLYEKIKKHFPKREQRFVQRVDTTQNAEGRKHRLSTEERIVFLTDDGKSFIQIGSYLLAINCLKPYPTWNRFKSKIEKAFNTLAAIVDIKGLQRIGLRYINRIEVPGPTVNLDHYFGFRPFVGSNLPQVMQNFIVGCMFPSSDEQDVCKVQLTNATPEKPGNSAFLLDLDYFLSKPQAVGADKALEWVETAHQQVETIFEGCLTERLRKIFRR